MNEKSIVHQLVDEWTFWLIQIRRNGPNIQYEIEPIVTFSTVEEFWKSFLQFPPILGLSSGGISIFKSGIKPAWEDPKNVGGQSISFSMQSMTQSEWENLVLCIVGGLFESKVSSPFLCGAIFQRKRPNAEMIAYLWFQSGEINLFDVSSAINVPKEQLSVTHHPSVQS